MYMRATVAAAVVAAASAFAPAPAALNGQVILVTEQFGARFLLAPALGARDAIFWLKRRASNCRAWRLWEGVWRDTDRSGILP